MIDRLSYDLRQAFPDMGGLSRRNLKYMRAFAVGVDRRANRASAACTIDLVPPLALIEKLDDKRQRLWYAAER